MIKKLTLIAIAFLFTVNVWGQQDYYDVTPGNGYGLRFWNSDNYKIHMGNTSLYHYGPVTSYSIKMNMNDTEGRGWTWGVVSQSPIAALSNTGNMQIAGNFTTMGKIGVGTDNPQKVLHSVGYYNMVQLRLERTGSAEGFCDLGGSSGDFRVWSGGYELDHRFVVKGNTGWVGIGTASPLTNLHINGNGGEPALDYEILKTNSSMMLSSTSVLGTNTKLYVGIGGSLYTWLQAYNNNSGYAQDIMLNPIGGQVAIGTTEIPSGYKLAVDGKIICEELQVEISDDWWADFVFEPNYHLMSLSELDNFIQENKHLPEIPTTQEVEENGISVGEMNAKLLQKIEELTLYVIELKKENEELNKKVESLIQE